jgi:hydroxymethylbilane synthase
MEGKGFFTKEIEDHLLSQNVDLAVHSHKDLETTEPDGLSVVAVSERQDPSELLLIRKECVDSLQRLNLKNEAVVGTSSARRKTQLKFFRPDVTISDLRGNVPTRVQKLRDGAYDAIMLAKAGVDRLKLDLSDLHVEVLDPTEFIPAPAQGVLAWQIRTDDTATRAEVEKLNRKDGSITTRVERSILKGCEGGCQLPLGVFCKTENEMFQLWVAYCPDVHSPLMRFYLEGKNPEQVVEQALSKISDYSDEKKKSS